ncbi:alpha-tocopherol transfer protein-like isoform X3 [Thrips palmi]|uniref:Alpha-tocopherol transfer protein-like isoform X3 n=1 Tax=Thrips palmi TaxID=161013 RepID=A0A6P8YUB7_THRPL|nr:alpha-tocopherol transfer protein-like isoform X3 [Thrips palmi]
MVCTKKLLSLRPTVWISVARELDPDLVKFVHSCEYDLEKAKKCAKDFYWSRDAVPELFSGWDATLPHFQSVFDTVTYAIMPRRTPDNFRVIFNSLKTSDTTNYVIVDITKVTLMVVESIFLTEPTVSGIVIIQDLEKATFSHFVKYVWSLPRKIQVYFEDGVPLKREKVHLINCPGIVDKGLKFMGRMIRKEDRDRMQSYSGDDYSELYKFVPKDCLPSDVGGNLPPLEELHELTVQRLIDFKEVFQKHSPGVKTE